MPFLESLTTGMGQAAGQGLIGTGIAALTGGFKGRPQWRDLSFMNDVANRLTPDEAARHNAFQDLTYGEDTRRTNERILQTAETLGMSPWELTGQAPMPMVGPMPNQDSSANKFTAAIGPMQTAQLQAKTEIAKALIAANTAKEVANIQTAGGTLPSEQAKTQISQRTLMQAQEGLAQAQDQAARNQTVLATLELLFKTLPEHTIQIGPYTFTSKKHFQNLQQLIQSETHAVGGNRGTMQTKEAIQNYIDSIPKSEWGPLRQDLEKAISTTFDAVGDTAGAGIGFLQDLIGR